MMRAVGQKIAINQSRKGRGHGRHKRKHNEEPKKRGKMGRKTRMHPSSENSVPAHSVQHAFWYLPGGDSPVGSRGL